MKTKAEKIVKLLESYSARDVDDNVLSTVLKTQQLVRELSDGSHN